MPVAHYENFPVASLLLPRRLRSGVEAIYWFARSADDLADEGDHPPAWRLEALDAYRRQLQAIEDGHAPSEPAWQRLATAIAAHRLPLQPFRDLLDAFSQDVVQSRYASYEELEDYCRRSANPVGCLMLHLFEAVSDQNLRDSDAICTSLQLLNFCQDVALDWQKDRVYIPADEMAAARVTEAQIADGIVDANWQRLFRQQLDRALDQLARGRPLGSRLTGRPGLELRAIVAGGERIGARLRGTQGDVFRHRPLLRPLDWLAIAWRACRPAPAGARAALSAPAP